MMAETCGISKKSLKTDTIMGCGVLTFVSRSSVKNVGF